MTVAKLAQWPGGRGSTLTLVGVDPQPGQIKDSKNASSLELSTAAAPHSPRGWVNTEDDFSILWVVTMTGGEKQAVTCCDRCMEGNASPVMKKKI